MDRFSSMSLEDHLKRDGSFKRQYKLMKEIGQGAFGKVNLAENKKDKQQYAVKVIRTRDATELREARQEIQIFKDLEHPHIVHYKDAFEVPDGVIVVMEYCENGDLQKQIEMRNPSLNFFPESQVVEWSIQICKALQYLHSNYVLHRDLKPANIFLAKNDVIKLGDFGVARRLADFVDVARTFVGTPLYLSPEMVQLKPYNHKSDVWSAGCCIYEIMALNPAIDPVPVRISQQWNVRPMPLNYSRDLRAVVESMLTIDFAQRPPIGEILQRFLRIQTTVQASEATPTVVSGLMQTIIQGSPAVAPGPSNAQRHSNAPLPPAKPRPARVRPASSPRISPKPVEAEPRRSSQGAEINEEDWTADILRPHGGRPVLVDSGVGDDVYEDLDSVVVVADAETDRKSRSTWYEDAQKTGADDFWTISADSPIVKNLAELGVRFNDLGQLVELTGSRFKFDSFSDDHATNQMRYEEIGDQITRYVYDLLETKLKMKRYRLPIGGNDDDDEEPHSFIFVTQDYATNDKKLLVLVHGPGVPRAGQWARRIIMNYCLAAGTQIPWIQRAVKEGYAVMVLNPNLNEHEITKTPIRENETGAKHALYVWDKVISTEVKAPKIAFVAHSAGASVVLQLAADREQEFKDRVFGIVLADTNSSFLTNIRPSVINLFAKRARNWASSDKPLDTALTTDRNGIKKFSSGETRHECTAGACMSAAVKFLNKRCK